MRAPNLNLVIGTVAILATGVIVYGVWRKGKTVVAAAGDAIAAVNPTNPNNIFVKAADAITQTVTQDPTASFTQRLLDMIAPSDAGAIATAPSYPRGNVVQIADYWKSIDQADTDAGIAARDAIAFDDSAFQSNEGGAPMGNPFIMRQGVRYGAQR